MNCQLTSSPVAAAIALCSSRLTLVSATAMVPAREARLINQLQNSRLDIPGMQEETSSPDLSSDFSPCSVHRTNSSAHSSAACNCLVVMKIDAGKRDSNGARNGGSLDQSVAKFASRHSWNAGRNILTRFIIRFFAMLGHSKQIPQLASVNMQ